MRRPHPHPSIKFSLQAARSATRLEVRLQSFADRWVATAADGPRTETGLGRTARSALTAAIESLAPAAAAELLTDPQLFAVSCEIRQAG